MLQITHHHHVENLHENNSTATPPPAAGVFMLFMSPRAGVRLSTTPDRDHIMPNIGTMNSSIVMIDREEPKQTKVITL